MYHYSNKFHVKAKKFTKCVVENSTRHSSRLTSMKQIFFCLIKLIDFNVFLVTFYLAVDWVVMDYGSILLL